MEVAVEGRVFGEVTNHQVAATPAHARVVHVRRGELPGEVPEEFP